MLKVLNNTPSDFVKQDQAPNYWAEYPERDVEYVRWYPCIVEPLSESDVWKRNQLAVYLHVPFCNQLCGSCPYNKMMTQKSVTLSYAEAIKKEIEIYASRPYIRDSEFITGYIGGGTPTALATEVLEDLIVHAKRHLNIKPDAHFTIESTPLEMSEKKAEMLMRQGINRVSMGIQSFDDALLARINRSHTREMIYKTIRLLRKAGFKEISVDFMYGLPGQTMESWKETIEEFLALEVESVSFYVFLLLPNSELFKRVSEGLEPPPPSAEEVDAMHDYTVQTLMSRGYVAVSNCDFGNDKQMSDRRWENQGVEVYGLGTKGYRGLMVPTFPRTIYLTHLWYNAGELLAVGPGAYGYIRDHIYLNEPDIGTYVQKIQSGELAHVLGTYVSPREKMSRNMALGIKLLRMSRKDFKDRYGIDMSVVFGEEIKKLEQDGLVRLTPEYLEVTYPKGWLYQDNISKAFYTEENHRLPQPSPTNTAILKFLKNNIGHLRPPTQIDGLREELRHG
jgi:oxygen-independent coproporphyrinogen III oxidase